MNVQRKKSVEPKDYKDRWEFVLTTGGNIICQRYFRINNFNPKSLSSYELTSVIRSCAATIDRDLKQKTQVYLELYAPQVFNSIEEMNNYYSDERNRGRIRHGHGIVIKNNNETDYVWSGTEAVPLGSKFDNGELTDAGIANKATYKFAFKVDGKEVCSVLWDGVYPKFVREKIDISNKWAKYRVEDIDRLGMEQYLLYKMGEGRVDLVYGIINAICSVCSYSDNNLYTVINHTKAITVCDSNGENKETIRIVNPKHTKYYYEALNDVLEEWNFDSKRNDFRMNMIR